MWSIMRLLRSWGRKGMTLRKISHVWGHVGVSISRNLGNLGGSILGALSPKHS